MNPEHKALAVSIGPGSRGLRWFATALLWLFALATLQAHELRPAYLELKEQEAGEFRVLWKTPMRGPMRLALSVEFSGRNERTGPVATQLTGEAAVQTWKQKSLEPLRGQRVHISGLGTTLTDALVRIQFLDGSTWVQRLTPQTPEAEIPPRQSAWLVTGIYTRTGVEHILFGVDHLLFVFGLLLLVDGRLMLLKTISSFTLAHSLTLALATFGLAVAPAGPLNASIALSILFLGPEIVRKWRGEDSLSLRHPWLVAFCFGLLHGFGFSSALSNTGLPSSDIPLALLGFNIGVELGQVAFVGLVLLLCRSFRQLEIRWPTWATRLPGYTIGALGAYWTIQRTLMLF